MNNTHLLFMSVCLLFLFGTAEATVYFNDGGTHTIDYVIQDGINISAGTKVTLTDGGWVDAVRIEYDSGAFTMNGGVIQNRLTDLGPEPTVITGGTIGGPLSLDAPTGAADCFVCGFDFAINGDSASYGGYDTGGQLTGTLLNGDPINVEFWCAGGNDLVLTMPIPSPPGQELAGDINGDRRVDLLDVVLLSQNWLYDSLAPAGYWKLDETIGTVAADSSPYGHDGTLINMDNYDWIDGVRGNALNFDGVDDYIEVTGYKGVTGTTSRSCTFWINTTSTHADILGWGRLYNDSQQTIQGQKWQIVFYNDEVGALVQGGNAFCAAPEVNDGQWHHVAIILDDTNEDGILNIDETQFYIDGDLREQSRAASFAVNTAAHNDVHIGKYPEGNTYLLNGSLDEVKIYYRALTQQEIQEFAD